MRWHLDVVLLDGSGWHNPKRVESRLAGRVLLLVAELLCRATRLTLSRINLRRRDSREHCGRMSRHQLSNAPGQIGLGVRRFSVMRLLGSREDRIVVLGWRDD